MYLKNKESIIKYMRLEEKKLINRENMQADRDKPAS